MKMRVLLGYVLAIVAVAAVSAPVWGDTPSTDGSVAQTKVVQIEMSRIGASDTVQKLPGKVQVLRKPNVRLPEGIEEIKAIDIDNTLLVRGEEGAIEKLRARIAALDVPPKEISLIYRWCELTAKDSEELGIKWLPLNNRADCCFRGPNFRGAEEDFIKRLTSHRIMEPRLGGPIPSFVSGYTNNLGSYQPANIAMRMTVTPWINQDGSISVRGHGWIRRANKLKNANPSGTAQPEKVADPYKTPMGTLPDDKSFTSYRKVNSEQQFILGWVGLAGGGGFIITARLHIDEAGASTTRY